ncbi:MAG: hypothetical protein IPH12_03730 [Saprospirales bacterium]|jgi:hypothetical protein|nr:hypothetical protein [Saprospirales bacterium]MBK8922420.1 hypothetical protein [Saprospirales bacterium]
MKTPFLSCIFLLLFVSGYSQTNVRAWYAQGQVWVVWQTPVPGPLTCGIYKKSTAFTNTPALISLP